METNRITGMSAAGGPAAGSQAMKTGEVTTFYSYDSAAVRSQALAHAGWLLAGRGHAKTPVLMIDWDLEGPGLHHYFCRPQDAGTPGRSGVLELFEACRDRLRAPGRGFGDDTEALAAHVLDSIDWDAHIERVDDGRPLYLMRAGRFDDSYGERADRLDWDALFCACPALFRSFAAHLKRRFTHVLIDCRSGRSAATSVCTALLADKMVGLFTPDPRSLDGLQGVVARALDYRCSHEDEQRPLLVYPLPIPPDGGGEARLAWRRGLAQRRLGQLDFGEVAGEGDAGQAVALAQQLFKRRLVTGAVLAGIAMAPAEAFLDAAVRRTRQRVDHQRALLVLVAAAVVEGAPHHALQAFQAARLGCEQPDHPVGQQRRADAGGGRAAAAAIHQHVGEAPRQVGGKAAEQGRTGAEQRVPVEPVDPFAVAVVETAGAHQVQGAAVVDSFEVAVPVETVEHAPGQLAGLVGRHPPGDPQLLAASLEQLKHALAFVVRPAAGKIVVQAGRFEVPVDHQHGCFCVISSRQ